ncbi:LUD domain-containing protein [Lacinutrix sp. MedPE-SW]|uniref:LUD domain-containing protein n=1 Tax=Lacinutrix sp. MedPE-SW TaxID=1860087 RepID=UPI000910F424|nr:LUD domain-containing protein [Lacinutrix sp. MedPE-SW]OIQ18815.1 MAG: lactate utilization protein B/C [Lacinutrix sp. MedPE-SW]
MSIFRNIFRSKSSKEKEEIKTTERGKYMPQVKLPIDESFTINFKSNGGKFLYCENLNEIFDNLNAIVEENEWSNKPAYFYDSNLEERFKSNNLVTTKHLDEATYFITTCENLIADDGSLLISSNQIAEKKLAEFPNNFIVFATTSQIVTNIGEGLRQIKTKNKQKLPTNITTIKHFKTLEEKDFLTYGSASKNLYLLLLEDL